MPRTKKGEATPRQFAYAQRLFGGKGKCKKEIALDVGYSPNAANSIKSKVENTVGFHSAIAKLAADSNNVALSVMHELQARGFENFSNKDLVGALNAIGNAWSKFNGRLAEDDPKNKNNGGNKLRTVVMQHIENQTLNTGPIREVAPPQGNIREAEVADEGEMLDF